MKAFLTTQEHLTLVLDAAEAQPDQQPRTLLQRIRQALDFLGLHRLKPCEIESFSGHDGQTLVFARLTARGPYYYRFDSADDMLDSYNAAPGGTEMLAAAGTFYLRTEADHHPAVEFGNPIKAGKWFALHLREQQGN